MKNNNRNNHNNRDIKFTYGKEGIKLLGQQLYSSPFNAISELVANSIDAGSKNILLKIDIRDKAKSTVLLFDDGSGMSPHEVESKYAQIGFKQREENNHNKKAMGRKGVGKLAALFLSESYWLISKKYDLKIWNIDLNDSDKKDLVLNKKTSVGNLEIDHEILEWFDTHKTGTILYMSDVDFSGLGVKSFEHFASDLSSFFLLDNLKKEEKINLCLQIKSKDKALSQFLEPFSLSDRDDYIEKIRDYYLSIVSDDIQIVEQFNGKPINHEKIKDDVKDLFSDDNISNENKQKILSNNNIKARSFDDVLSKSKDKLHSSGVITIDGKEYQYLLTGWIGAAIKIDSIFKPKLRLYIRNKLAVEDLLQQLKISSTQVTNHYIGGQISFDILDHDDLKELTTTNRQGLNSIKDERIDKLNDLLTPIVNQLYEDRKKWTDNNKKFISETNDDFNSLKKTELVKSAQDNFSDNNILVEWIEKNIKGEIAKDNAKVFLSHSGKKEYMTDEYEELLLKIGVKRKEIFYTGSPEGEDNWENNKELSDVIVESITDTMTMIVYFVDENFVKSKFCLFEAGAGWAVKYDDKSWAVVTTNYNRFLLQDTKILENNRPKVTWPNYNLLFQINGSENYKESLFMGNENYKKLEKEFMKGYDDIAKLTNRIVDHLNTRRPDNNKLAKLKIYESLDYPLFVEKINDHNSNEFFIYKNLLLRNVEHDSSSYLPSTK